MSADNKKTLRLFIVAVVLGVAAAGLAMLYLDTRETELRELLTPKEDLVAVVVASRDLVKGDKLGTATLAVRQVPIDYVDENVVRPDQFEQVDGQVLTQNLASGRPLRRTYVDREFPLDFSDTIPEKRRAMTIQVDEVNSISGLIRPGNRVDIFVNLPPGSDEKQKENEVLPVLENVEVLATGRESARDYEEKVRLLRAGFNTGVNENYTTLTLNVTPKEAALLTLALDKGELMALLRNRKDTSGSGFGNVSTATVKSNAQRLAAQAAVRSEADQLKGNVTVGEDGVIRTKDGVALKNQNLVVGEDGTIMTKDGVVLSGRGLSINDKGELVDANGNVVDPDSLTVAADGSLITKDGVVLDGAKSVQAGKLTANEDGTVTTGNGIVLAGAKLRDDGKLELADGTVVDPKDLVIRADGTVMTKDGKVLDGVKAGQLAGKLTKDDNGNLVSAGGAVIKGAKLREDGMLELADGSVVHPDDLVVNADGSVSTRDGKLLEGLTADNAGLPGQGGPGSSSYEVEYIVGGVSQDSVATINKVPVLPLGQEGPEPGKKPEPGKP